MSLRVVGALSLAAGVLLGGQFLWSAPDLVREIQEAAQGNHLSLGLMGTLYPGARTVGSVLIGGIGATLLTVGGALFLRRSRSH
jgi:hypothetical protein